MMAISEELWRLMAMKTVYGPKTRLGKWKTLFKFQRFWKTFFNFTYFEKLLSISISWNWKKLKNEKSDLIRPLMKGAIPIPCRPPVDNCALTATLITKESKVSRNKSKRIIRWYFEGQFSSIIYFYSIVAQKKTQGHDAA